MFFYKLGFIPTSFVVIGCGGTGGRLVPLLAQFIKTITWIQNPRIFLIDYDIVEEKNLIRQNFIKPDINRPKAIVLAERYNKAFDVTIIPVHKHVETADVVLSEITHADQGLIKTSLSTINNAFVFMCVDSANARRAILNNILGRNGQKNLFFIDAGNEDDFGQIQIFTPEFSSTSWDKDAIKKLPIPGMGIPFDTVVSGIPMPTLFYDKMVDAPTKSCAELDQTLAINALMATTMMGIAQNLIYQKPIPFSRIDISLKAGSIPFMMSVESLYEGTLARKSQFNNMMLPPHVLDFNPMFSAIHSRLTREFKHDAFAAEKAKTAKPVKKKIKKLLPDEEKEIWTDELSEEITT